MWQVADRAGDDVVFMIIQYDRKCTQGFYEGCVCIHLFFRYFGGRGENKVSVLDQDWFGIGKTTLFGTGHRVSSDKVILQSQPDDLVMDRSFDTSDVSQDHIIMQVRHHLL